ncbi:alanine acetyltransferase [Dehalococcoides mccartyi]|jgi:ribosomal-protein-alanine N-acetyltransferase|uniref:GNAT family N-acetyltransferase n=1 Tax=Dehalococcoides TaxID=61434 RepID=UPI0004E068F7|nr:MULTISPECIES: GNAT family protein [Dehalococcoides]AII58411.1 alanine acetyltransferase [Dehalococcoides mccartyi CG1]APH12982.1 alanine acetyltransferase [Dehalococcoides mccartyi]QYY57611.1 GNAT family N-acetyltransferase [Dehalococcoides mccartyi]BAQ35178.1 hypothetical protein UCH007_12200 [Dehalococcoides sp. UCH007]
MFLSGNQIYIRFLKDTDAESLLDLHLANKEFFQRYSPVFKDDYYTLDSKRKYISDSFVKRENDQLYSFGIFLKNSDKLIGDVSLFHICRGALQKCLIGYTLDKLHNGKGYATEAVVLAVDFAFDGLKLHRVEAGVMPENKGSMRVLEKAGFHEEGLEQKGIRINGQWEDHQIFAVISAIN